MTDTHNADGDALFMPVYTQLRGLAQAHIIMIDRPTSPAPEQNTPGEGAR